jgi:hypothetical protein
MHVLLGSGAALPHFDQRLGILVELSGDFEQRIVRKSG